MYVQLFPIKSKREPLANACNLRLSVYVRVIILSWDWGDCFCLLEGYSWDDTLTFTARVSCQE